MNKKTDNQINKDFENEWWKDFFIECKECINNCKQSWKILELSCRKYKEK